MKDGYIKVAAGSVEISVADTISNTKEIKLRIAEAHDKGVNLLVLPELCITGYTCGDLFYSDVLLSAAYQALKEICIFTKDKYPIVVVGVPIKYQYKLYKCAAVIHRGRILGLVPKTYLPNYSEFYEMRQFSSAKELEGNGVISIADIEIPFGTEILFRHSIIEAYSFGVELCEDLWAQSPPSEELCKAGAVIIANPSASDELIGKEAYRRLLVSSTSARLICGYIYSNAGPSESTQDMVFSNHNLICENGAIHAENKPFGDDELLISEIDVLRLVYERHRITSNTYQKNKAYTQVPFNQEIRETKLTIKVDPNPFVPPNEATLSERAETILRIQSQGLKKRLEHTKTQKALVGISGGLDSCLALLVMSRAMDLMSRPQGDIIAVSMPGFGTTKKLREMPKNYASSSA